MQTPAQFNLIKNDKPKPEEPAHPAEPRRTQIYLVIVDESGVPSIRTIENAQEMMFGDTEYLAIPKDA